MRSKLIAALAVALMVGAAAGAAFSKGMTFGGKVTAVEGDKVTVKIEKGKASAIKPGASVEIELKEDGKGAGGGDQMQGC